MGCSHLEQILITESKLAIWLLIIRRRLPIVLHIPAVPCLLSDSCVSMRLLRWHPNQLATSDFCYAALLLGWPALHGPGLLPCLRRLAACAYARTWPAAVPAGGWDRLVAFGWIPLSSLACAPPPAHGPSCPWRRPVGALAPLPPAVPCAPDRLRLSLSPLCLFFCLVTFGPWPVA